MDEELLNALKSAKSGDWDNAHEVVQCRSDKGASWIHGYLHRLEGDDGNAGYWYRQAGVPFPAATLDEEWQQIHEALTQEKNI